MSSQPRPWLLAFLLAASAGVVSLGCHLYNALLSGLDRSSPQLLRFADSASAVSVTAEIVGYLAGVLLSGLAIRRLPEKNLFLASFTAAGGGALLIFLSATRSVPVAVFGSGVLWAAQGLFFPLAVTLLANAHPVGQRARALFVLMCGVGIGPVMSPLLAGKALQYLVEWRLIFLYLGVCTLLFGISFYSILFSGANPIAPPSELDAEALSWRSWVPGLLLTGCLAAGVVAILTESIQISTATEVAQRFVTGAEAASEMYGMAGKLLALSGLLGLATGVVYGDRLAAKSSRGRVLFLLPLMVAGPPLAHWLGSPQRGWELALAAFSFGGAAGLLRANLHAAVLDVTPERNWAKGIALLAALQFVTPQFGSIVIPRENLPGYSDAYSWPWVLMICGWAVCLYTAWAFRMATPIPPSSGSAAA